MVASEDEVTYGDNDDVNERCIRVFRCIWKVGRSHRTFGRMYICINDGAPGIHVKGVLKVPGKLSQPQKVRKNA